MSQLFTVSFEDRVASIGWIISHISRCGYADNFVQLSEIIKSDGGGRHRVAILKSPSKEHRLECIKKLTNLKKQVEYQQ